jgi:hypothetical protein
LAIKKENYTNNRTMEGHNSENDGSDEASKLRQHTNRMETRIAILVDHNKQLDSQLKRLRQLVQLPDDIADGSCGSRFGTLRSKVVRATSLQNEKSQEFDSVLALKSNNGHDGSDSSSGSSEEIQSSGNSSLNLSEQEEQND